ncbi:MAG TPA: transposase [Allosphingosinicella sp.]|jgi:hypothetical protein
MPRLIETNDSEVATLGQLIEALESQPFDARDEDAFAAFGPMLKRLANDRDFLAQTIASELAGRCAAQDASNSYGAQVIMLHAGRSFTIRANIWPEADHSLVRANGRGSFFYDVPHDHNVSFLTVGYAGPGYWSDYYEYDYGSVRGVPGESAGLRFVERSRLEQGKVQLYRAHRDVHSQLPPDRLSITLNVMETSPASAYRDQYIFDVAHDQVAAVANPLPHDSLFAAAAALADAESLDMLDRIVRSHASTRVRYSALRARASAAPCIDERRAILERGASGQDLHVRDLVRAKIAEIDSVRAFAFEDSNSNGASEYSSRKATSSDIRSA